MIELRINGKTLQVEPGTTILQAAQGLDIDIPTLCYDDRVEHFTSCMLCVVLDQASEKLIPACSAPVEYGMDIITDNEAVFRARKNTLDLLLSEHVGDCEAPCHRICPAEMNIPLMLRQIERNELDKAIITIKNDIPLPAVLGRICPAPCEKGCNRRQHDEAVSICLLKKYVADVDLAQPRPYQPIAAAPSGKRVAVVGAGPAGLTAAYYLTSLGHAVTLFDKNELPGGALQYETPEERLPRDVLRQEIRLILERVEFNPNFNLFQDNELETLRQSFDAIALGLGPIDNSQLYELGFEITKKGIAVDSQTFMTNHNGIFAGGAMVAGGKMAVKAVGHGKNMALAIDQFLRGEDMVGRPHRFQSMMGRLQDKESVEFLKEAVTEKRIEPQNANFEKTQAQREAARCFHCDCRKPQSCQLRLYADHYQADRNRFKLRQRLPFQRVVQHADVVYEPGKCIRCGLCIRLTEKFKEPLGLSFINRGFDVRIAVPFQDELKDALTTAAKEVVEACPTAALSFKNAEEYEKT